MNSPTLTRQQATVRFAWVLIVCGFVYAMHQYGCDAVKSTAIVLGVNP